MDTCTVETGLLRKKPCGNAGIVKCATCERPLCTQHAVAQLTPAKKKSGAYMCKECDEAQRDYDKTQAAVAKHEKEKRDAETIKSMMNPAAPKPKTSYTQGAPAAAPAGAKPAAAAPPTAAPKPADDAPLEFTPSKPKPADDAPLEFTPDDKPKK